MARFSSKACDIRAYLDDMGVNTFHLCQELEKLSDDALVQLWTVLRANENISMQVENAYWKGLNEGRSESYDDAYDLGVMDGEKRVTPEDFTSAMLIEALKNRGLWESDKVIEP